LGEGDGFDGDAFPGVDRLAGGDGAGNEGGDAIRTVVKEKGRLRAFWGRGPYLRRCGAGWSGGFVWEKPASGEI